MFDDSTQEGRNQIAAVGVVVFTYITYLLIRWENRMDFKCRCVREGRTRYLIPTGWKELDEVNWQLMLANAEEDMIFLAHSLIPSMLLGWIASRRAIRLRHQRMALLAQRRAARNVLRVARQQPPPPHEIDAIASVTSTGPVTDMIDMELTAEVPPCDSFASSSN